jgi:C-terminal processing protease CtpA/Prc
MLILVRIIKKLKPGDIIIEIDQEPVDTMKAFMQRVREYEKGNKMLLLVNRKGATQYFILKIG